MSNKSKYWVAVLWPENLSADWQDTIGDTLQLPYAYCVHSPDDDSQKEHVHLMVAFPNTTTYNHALTVFKLLGDKAVNSCQAIINVRHMYNYLIHDTEDAQKKGKPLYPKEARITGNNFDIHHYEQLSVAEKDDIKRALAAIILRLKIVNYRDFYAYVAEEYAEDISYLTVAEEKSAFFERLTKGNFQKYAMFKEYIDGDTGEVKARKRKGKD